MPSVLPLGSTMLGWTTTSASPRSAATRSRGCRPRSRTWSVRPAAAMAASRAGRSSPSPTIRTRTAMPRSTRRPGRRDQDRVPLLRLQRGRPRGPRTGGPRRSSASAGSGLGRKTATSTPQWMTSTRVGELAVPARQQPLVVVGDRHREGGAAQLLVEHRTLHVDVVGMGREAVGPAGEPSDDPRGEGRVGRPMRVDVIDVEGLDPAGERRPERDRRQGPDEELRRADVADDRPPPGREVAARAAAEPVPLGGEDRPGRQPEVVGPTRRGPPPRAGASPPARERAGRPRPGRRSARARASRRGRTSPTAWGSATSGTRPEADARRVRASVATQAVRWRAVIAARSA